MRALATAFLVLASMLDVHARCGDGPTDAAAVAAARQAVEAGCRCAGAPSHGVFVACAKSVAWRQAAFGALPASCAGEVQRCAARSTCGRAGVVTCCRVVRGVPRCRITRPDRCRNGCVGALASCCDACGAAGCATTTTAAPTTTTTTTLADGGPCDGGAGVPVCDGTCPAGMRCAAMDEVDVGRRCACFRESVTPCSAAGYPGCGGACFGGKACRPFRSVGVPNLPGDEFVGCACVDADARCEGGEMDVCVALGACPPDQSCNVAIVSGAARCGCGSP